MPGSQADLFLDLSSVDAVIFDMDGVMTDTAAVHAAAWKEMFDAFLRERSQRLGEPFVPFDPEDYRRYVDGKPRYDGVRSFLQARGIDLPEGSPADGTSAETVHGLGDRKDELFVGRLRRSGARRFESSVAFVQTLLERGVRCAIISASRNMREVLAAAGIADLFPIRVDGLDSDQLGLAGKPDPAIFLEAARRLGVEPARAAIVEDALSGVEAGRRGGFGIVIGIDRFGQHERLYERGADIVLGDLAELRLEDSGSDPPGHRLIRELPSAIEERTWLRIHVRGRRPSIFLDYDGTLTPIVPRPEDALLPEASRDTLRRLAERLPVAILSGRDLADVRSMIGIPTIVYAGSHGFDIQLPDGRTEQRGTEFLPDLDSAEEELRTAVRRIPGAWVERKRFGLAVHVRQVDDALVPEVERAVSNVGAAHPRLRRTGGKKVFELRPGIEWDKGRALRFLLEMLGLDGPDVVPLYLGDDETDEDAFAALRGRGHGIVVASPDEDRPTAADARLASPDEVREFLNRIASDELGS